MNKYEELYELFYRQRTELIDFINENFEYKDGDGIFDNNYQVLLDGLPIFTKPEYVQNMKFIDEQLTS